MEPPAQSLCAQGSAMPDRITWRRARRWTVLRTSDAAVDPQSSTAWRMSTSVTPRALAQRATSSCRFTSMTSRGARPLVAAFMPVPVPVSCGPTNNLTSRILGVPSTRNASGQRSVEFIGTVWTRCIARQGRSAGNRRCPTRESAIVLSMLWPERHEWSAHAGRRSTAVPPRARRNCLGAACGSAGS